MECLAGGRVTSNHYFILVSIATSSTWTTSSFEIPMERNVVVRVTEQVTHLLPASLLVLVLSSSLSCCWQQDEGCGPIGPFC